ncbi:MAG: hypothetical protein A2X47_03455 [Lentisphaerae bacterium GWF2_38_69]|nr:MAG: hypothetical protein A2X47_03455 [Lentisphaerae bacterium GWF2_38_69]
MRRKKLSIIIPLYNEEKTIIKLLEKVSSVELGVRKEIVIVNDGSTDSSSCMIKEWIANSQNDSEFIYLEKENEGKGSAVRHGIKKSTGDVVIIQDADLEYNPEDYKQCIEPILNGNEKVVYGSRELSAGERHYSYFLYLLGGYIVTNWINFLFGAILTDEPTCYKTFDGNLIRNLDFKGNSFEWEPEVTCKLLKLGYNIKEVGITYNPRTKEQGKKIKPSDGFQALWITFLWRFISVRKDRNKLNLLSIESEYLKKCRRLTSLVWLVVGIAFAVRLFVALPSIDNPLEKLTRPDSGGYINSALSLVETGKYNETPQSDSPEVYRTPGYSLFLAGILKVTGSFKWTAIMSCFLSALTCLFIFYCGNLFGGFYAGIGASLLFCFNITSIAISPLLLSDTLFTFFVAVQVFFFFKFIKSKRSLYFLLAILVASLGSMIRDFNQFWILPAIFILFIYKEIPLTKKLTLSLCSIILAFFILCPWMARNYMEGGGFRLSNLSGNLLFNNGAVLLSKVNNYSPDYNREKLREMVERTYEANPQLYNTLKKKTDYQNKLLLDIIAEHPVTYALLCFRPWILLPDAPTFFEVLGYTQTGRGTFTVLSEKGILAATLYYFNGQLYLLFLCLPLLIVVFITYLLFIIQLLKWIFCRKWMLFFVFLACAEYYLFAPGPITMPRYQLPALITICVMASMTANQIIKKIILLKQKKSA